MWTVSCREKYTKIGKAMISATLLQAGAGPLEGGDTCINCMRESRDGLEAAFQISAEVSRVYWEKMRAVASE